MPNPRLQGPIPLIAVLLILMSHPSHLACQAWLPRVEVGAGGGFVGVHNAAVRETPAFDCDLAGNCTLVDGKIDLLDDSRRVWRPALATGIVLRWRLDYDPNDSIPDKRFGIGLGGQMVFTPAGDGTRVLPALTFHAGTKATQLFAGFLLGRVDKVRFPNGSGRIRVNSGDKPDFIESDGYKKPNFFIGVVIDGAAVTK